MSKYKTLLVVCLLLCWPINAIAYQHSTAFTPIQLRFKIFEYDAEAGDHNAQMVLAQVFLRGVPGVPVDPNRGLYWLERAAEAGKPELQEYLGEVFHYGTYGVQDHKKALQWYTRAAERGLGSAMDYVGLFYSGGLGGLKQDCPAALTWYDKAISAGFEHAKSNMIWTLATCPQMKFRDGKRALRMAQEVINAKSVREAGDLDNLAAAYAQAQDFESAISTQLEAISLLDSDSQQTRYQFFLKRLNLYIQNRTWHGSSNANPEYYDQ